jgi:uncharacterized membrane protein
MNKETKIQAGIVLMSILTSILSYQYLPDSIPTHWNYLGQVDAYSSKLSNLIAFPSLIALLFVILIIAPKLDPLKKNINDLGYPRLITILGLFFLVIQYFVILWGIGISVPVTIIFPGLLSILFYYIGEIMIKSKRNWTVGIRTSWTLSSDKVWEKTHVIGGKLFKLSVPIFIFSMFFPSLTFLIVMGYIMGITIFLIAYSYVEYKKENK